MKNNLFLFIFLAFIAIFFYQIFLGKIPVPADTIIGLYHPFRDLYSKEYPNGIPFKNFLITDPVRQQYPWRKNSIETFKNGELPIWNPYSFAGIPLLANFQSASLYPLNILFGFVDFKVAWSILVVLQPFLAGIFMFLFLRQFLLNRWACLLGGVTYAFSGFSIAWLEWNTLGHIAIWLPLLLLAKEKLLKKTSLKWIGVFIFAECSAIFAGHLQVYFYFFLISNAYLFVRILQLSYINNSWSMTLKNSLKRYRLFVFLGAMVFALTSIQFIPTLQLILASARSVDQSGISKEGWFIPWQHIIQFVVPDFFGNPTTLNYWGVWNYGEFVGFVGVVPLIFSFYALLFRRDKKTLFFGCLLFLSLLFAFPTVVAKLPYLLNVPFISTSQPTRLLFIADFSLAVLTAFGLDTFYKSKKNKNIMYPIIFLASVFLFLLLSAYMLGTIIPGLQENSEVAQRNLFFPITIFVLSVCLLLVSIFGKNRVRLPILIGALILLAVIDLFRFEQKFTPFTKSEYLFPSTKTIEFLQKNTGNYRIMLIDDRILPPNFSIMYSLQGVSGYDPLYLQRYGELIAASERGRPDISGPLGFNRIITPHNYNSKIIDLLGVKYILSLSDIQSSKLKKVFQEGETRVYENINVLPRAFLVDAAIPVGSKQDVIEMLFDNETNLRKVAFFEVNDPLLSHPRNRQYKPIASLEGNVRVITYSENYIGIETQSNRGTFLVITDTYYPTWHAKIDGVKTNIYRTDYNFRGINIPKGKHVVEFYTTLF